MIERDVPLSTGLTYHLREWGSPESADKTIVLVHGFLDSSATWLPLARAGFADGRHLIAPDMRGHGDSDRVGAGGYYHFADYLADLDALVSEHFDGKALTLIGHSMGGSVCAYFAGIYPERVERLVLMEGMGPAVSKTPAPERIGDWIAAWKRIRTTEERSYSDHEDAAARLKKHDRLLPAEFALEFAKLGTRRRDDGRLVFKHDRLHATRGPYPFRYDVAAELWQNIKCPVLALEGSESIFARAGAEADRRYANINELTRLTIDGAGHMMQRHQPAAIADALVTFLAASS